MGDFICLGIESTAHTFGVSLVTDEGDVLSNERKLFTTTSGGFIPAEVSDHHVAHWREVVNAALEKAGKTLQDVDLIAFSQSPGIGHTLRIGASIARSLALLLAVPIVGVNHCIAHLEIGRLKARPYGLAQATSHETENSENKNDAVLCSDPVLLYASGANTQVIAYEGKKYRVFGETLDLGIGNFLDTIARKMGLGFPGGPAIMKLAAQGKEYIPLPYVVKGMDVSFSGIQTKIEQLMHTSKHSKEDLCYSIQETVFAMLLEVSERAMAHTGKKELLLGGGVACNTRLQEMAHKMCADRGATCYVLPNEFNVDNAAMIAWNGILDYDADMAAGREPMAVEDADIDPYLRTDAVDVKWRD